MKEILAKGKAWVKVTASTQTLLNDFEYEAHDIVIV